MRTILIAMALLLFTTDLAAEKPHPIDVKLEACMDKDPSTAGMVDCIGDAYVAWDKELNAVYQALSKKLTPEQREALKASQRQWIVWRDAEFALLDRIYGTLEGTMYLTLAADDRMKIVKARALELRSHKSLLEIDE